MRTKIAFFDIDGTVIDEYEKCSDDNLKMLWELSNSGVMVGYVTSRTNRRIKNILKELPCDFIATFNGSYIECFRNSECKEKCVNGFQKEYGLELLENLYSQYGSHTIRAYAYPYEICGKDLSRDGRILGNANELLVKDDVRCFQRIRIYKVSAAEINLFLNLKFEIQAVQDGADVIIESKKYNKGFAVNYLLDYYRISREFSVAFGDSLNDAAMFSKVNTAICVNKNISLGDELKDCHFCSIKEFFQKVYRVRPKRINTTIPENRCIFMLREVGDESAIIPRNKIWEQGFKRNDCIVEDLEISKDEVALFVELAEKNKAVVADYIAVLSENLKRSVGDFPVIVSLVRGGVVHGVLCKLYYQKVYGVKIAHYAIGLLRDNGVDEIALDDIVQRHGDSKIRFVDGWTGSGLVSQKLKEHVGAYNKRKKCSICDELSAVVDTSRVCRIHGTMEDVILPDSIMSSTMCGMLSSICITDYPNSYYGATVWNEKQMNDYSNWYCDLVANELTFREPISESEIEFYGKKILNYVSEKYGIYEKKRIRMGIGESTRAIYRSRIDFFIMKDLYNSNVSHILAWANKWGIPILEDKQIGTYKSIAILKE